MRYCFANSEQCHLMRQSLGTRQAVCAKFGPCSSVVERYRKLRTLLERLRAVSYVTDSARASSSGIVSYDTAPRGSSGMSGLLLTVILWCVDPDISLCGNGRRVQVVRISASTLFWI